MSTKPRSPRRTSIESLASVESNGTFDGEMDDFLHQLLKKKKVTEGSSKEEESEEDNISEEKVKRELNENEKGERAFSSDLGNDQSSDHNRSESPWSEASPVSSPEPEVTVGGTPPEVASDNTGSGMDNDSEHPPSRLSDDDDYSVDDFGLTDDMTDEQRRAMFELQQMCLDLDLAEVGYSDEDPPEYNVKARVRQLNKELAADPTPLDDERRWSIKFKDNLVDLVAPPPDYPSDEEEGPTSASHPDATPKSGSAGGNVTVLNLNQMNLNGAEKGGGGDSLRRQGGGLSFDVVDADDQWTVHASGDGGSRNDRAIPPIAPVSYSNGSGGPEDDKVLVQRGKTFELISASDLTAEERDMFLPPSDDTEDDIDSSAQPEDAPSPTSHSEPAPTPADSSFQPTPPREPRPSTASGAQSRRPIATLPRRRVQSATPARKIDQGGIQLNLSYRSPYAQADELKKLGESQKKQKEQRDLREKEIAKLANDQKQRENDEAFMAWLTIKRKSGAWRREENEDEQTATKKKTAKASADDQSSQDKESEAAFTHWLKSKRVQKRREKHVEEKKQEEEEQGWYDRPRQECDKAFRQYVFQEWIRKKNQDTKKAKKQEVARQRINKLLVRRTRKAMQLAWAIRQSQNFRYVDYYGYRY